MCEQHEQAEHFSQRADSNDRQDMREIGDQSREVNFERNYLPKIVCSREEQHQDNQYGNANNR
jgi:hypothetical protein